MQDKTIITLVVGSLSIISTITAYTTYMICGPGGDGVIFGTVVGAIGTIAGGIIGFKFGASGSQN